MEAPISDSVSLKAQQPSDLQTAPSTSARPAISEYLELFRGLLHGPIAPEQAPITANPLERANNLKASAYFLDASLVGICCISPEVDAGIPPGHTHALVYLVEFGREPWPGDPGEPWIAGTNAIRTDMRAAEIAAVLAGYVRWMGFDALGHVHGATSAHLEALAVRAGLARVEQGQLVAPFLGRGFRIGAVTCAYEMAEDLPLASNGSLEPDDPSVQLGKEGTRPAWWSSDQDKRPLHLGRYPMERIARVNEPTTLVMRDRIQRVPKRGDFFYRAAAGDLGAKAKEEMSRFPMKHPYALGMAPLIRGMVPLQGTRESFANETQVEGLSDAQWNADSIKALGYFLGADFVGICEAEPWMYYSHDAVSGEPIEAYHKYAVCMLIDQGFETMEGASGDDWISASQSMRAYMRGAEIAGIMAAHCRSLGHSARSHTNADSDVIHNPVIVMSGLGEVSRIGDTLINPFIGPRSKSVVFTTDLPMAVDKPINFNLQSFCESCRKCARECPCNAITFGPKILFNGYEIWKADVEKCAKYRITQQKGSACGRCMKTCPWNREDTALAQELIWRSIEHPELAQAIALDDDLQGNGARNPVKKWWFDLEVVDGIALHPRAGTNARDLSLGREEKLAKLQKLAIFPPELQPVGGTTLDQVVPVDRDAGQALYAKARADLAAIRGTGDGVAPLSSLEGQEGRIADAGWPTGSKGT
ncbi:MAG: 4Fe-4S dicluster domain-containing protein [Brevundimonas sp.]|nr:4Fe-4S dicluster domain-containing protein [Brevundimonas sp.]